MHRIFVLAGLERYVRLADADGPDMVAGFIVFDVGDPRIGGDPRTFGCHRAYSDCQLLFIEIAHDHRFRRNL